MDTQRKISTLQEALPVLTRHEGVWEGAYRYFDRNDQKVDEHQSMLVCRLPTQGAFPYYQTNHYTWENGQSEVRDFPARFKNGRLEWDNSLISGWAADVYLDDHLRTTMLYWVRADMPDCYIYEMIHISDCNQHRSRVWQWFKGGRLFKRTLIDETKVSDDWSAYPV